MAHRNDYLQGRRGKRLSQAGAYAGRKKKNVLRIEERERRLEPGRNIKWIIRVEGNRTSVKGPHGTILLGGRSLLRA